MPVCRFRYATDESEELERGKISWALRRFSSRPAPPRRSVIETVVSRVRRPRGRRVASLMSAALGYDVEYVWHDERFFEFRRVGVGTPAVFSADAVRKVLSA